MMKMNLDLKEKTENQEQRKLKNVKRKEWRFVRKAAEKKRTLCTGR
jgi:hypothetical protein